MSMRGWCRSKSLAVLVPAAVLVDRDKFVLTQQAAVALLGRQRRLDVLVVAFESTPLLVVVGVACGEVGEALGVVVAVAAGAAVRTRPGRVDVAEGGTVLGRVLRRRGVLDEGELLAAYDLVEPLLSLVVAGLREPRRVGHAFGLDVGHAEQLDLDLLAVGRGRGEPHRADRLASRVRLSPLLGVATAVGGGGRLGLL